MTPPQLISGLSFGWLQFWTWGKHSSNHLPSTAFDTPKLYKIFSHLITNDILFANNMYIRRVFTMNLYIIYIFSIDIDECKEGTDNCDIPERATCTNTEGSFTCSCKEGWMEWFGAGTTEKPCHGKFWDHCMLRHYKFNTEYFSTEPKCFHKYYKQSNASRAATAIHVWYINRLPLSHNNALACAWQFKKTVTLCRAVNLI